MIHSNYVKGSLVLSLLALVAAVPLGIMNSAEATVNQLAWLELTPEDSSNFTGEEHTVTATVTTISGPAVGVTVNFEVTGAHSESGSDTTDSEGKATFTYTGTNIGDDTITASALVIEDIQVPVRDSAQKHWSMFVIPESPVGAIAMISASLAAVAGFVFWKNRSKGMVYRND